LSTKLPLKFTSCVQSEDDSMSLNRNGGL
jgi:hypothetical protein